jgi:hypothetical protein
VDKPWRDQMRMSQDHVRGRGAPSVNSQWRKTTVSIGLGANVNLLVTPEAASAGDSRYSQLLYTLLEQPAVLRNKDGSPKLSITFVLRKQPNVGMINISPLVERAIVAIDLTFLPLESLFIKVSSRTEEFRPLFAREATFYIVDLENARSMGEITVNNGLASAALNLTLERDHALILVDALNGKPTSIRVGIWLNYRTLGFSDSAYPGGSVELHAPLEDVLVEALQGQWAETAIHLVAPNKNQKGFSEVPKRTKNTKPRPGPPGNILRVARLGRRVTSLWNAVRPSNVIAAPAHTVLSSQGVMGNQPALELQDLNIIMGTERSKHLPVISKKSSDVPWPDRIDPDKRYWYPPFFVPVKPGTTTLPENSPFLFSYRTMGHDISGRPSLEATISIRLRRTMSDAVSQRAEELGNIQIKPVAVKNLSCLLEIPFRDMRGKLQRERIRAIEVIESGDEVNVIFRLVNDWVRLAYGSLAYSDFQPGEPIRLSTAYTFEAYYEIKNHRFEFSYGGKSAQLAVIDDRRTRATLDNRDYIRLSDGVIQLGGNELKLAKLNEPIAPIQRAMPVFSVSRPLSGFQFSALPVVRPDMQLAPSLSDKIKKKKYAIRTRAHRDTSDMLLPCRDFSTLYVEERDTGPQSVPCDNTLSLGETEYRLYEQLPLPTQGFKVMRSLQIPGRFLVVPKVYAITRFAATEGAKAFRPSVLLYSTIDIDDLSKSRCVIMASLQPQVALFERQRLFDELSQNFHPKPIVEYLTEIDGEFSFDWALPSTGPSGLLRLETEVTLLWDSFQVSLVTDAIGVPQLQEILSGSGISGSVTLRLRDGSSLRSTLRMDLSRIVGPWDSGPIEVEAVGGGSTMLRNRIEATVNVSDLMVVKDGRTTSTVPVEARLGKDNDTSIQVDQPFDTLLPIYMVEPSAASLTEIRTFIEDIAINLVLVNQMDLDKLGFKKIKVKGRVQDLPEEHYVEFNASSPIAASLDFLLPLTVYLSSPEVELQATVTDTTDQERQLSWVTWPLSNGVIVEVTPEFIGA